MFLTFACGTWLTKEYYSDAKHGNINSLKSLIEQCFVSELITQIENTDNMCSSLWL